MTRRRKIEGVKGAQPLRVRSGSFAMFTAIRRASSFMGGIGPVSNPLSLLLRFPIFRFDADSDLFELANDFSSLS